MANGYTINRSNYTLRKRRQTVSGGVIFERDFMTTTNLGGWDSGSIPYGEGNFKMYYRTPIDIKKKLRDNNWIENPCSGGPFWTGECVGQSGVPEEEQIKIRPNVNSLLDFAYYGSCSELIKSTITKIILSFPAELMAIDGAKYGIEGTILENDFAIDLFSKIIPEGEKNPLRYFYPNFGEYVIIDESGTTNGIVSVEVRNINPNCGLYKLFITDDTGNTYTVWNERFYDGTTFLYTNLSAGSRIRPTDKHLENFFDNLDDFSSLLLNRKTNPIYTIEIDYPQETETGVETYRRVLTWPTVGGWNLQIEGEGYSDYLRTLLSLADFYDEYYTDNLWRMLTHDSVKTMDLTFSNPAKDEDTEDYNIGTSRLHGLFLAIGRQFDDIKRAITNIKSTPNISYDGNNNVPDYFLSDKVSLQGFEVYNIDKTLEKEDETEQLFEGVLTGYNPQDANSFFLRNLSLNAVNILKKKGTREGIESLLGVFGMISKDRARMLSGETVNDGFDYEISEYIGVVENSYEAKNELSGGTEIPLKLEAYNAGKITAETDSPEKDYDTLYGLPAMIKYAQNDSGITKYIIPWYDRNKKYDGDFYFQSKGGWSKYNGKYEETLKYFIIVGNISDLPNVPVEKIHSGSYVYVSNLNELESYGYYDFSDASNYFYLNDIKEHELVHYQGSGWTNVSLEEAATNETIKYLESIVDDYKANNPHTGFGLYDSGDEYIEYLEVPLKYSMDLNAEGEPAFNGYVYDCDGNLNYDGKVFDIDYVEDNVKCWYFNPLTENGNIGILNEGQVQSVIEVSDEWTTFNSSARTFDFINEDSGSTADEITADSIINTKRIKIKFYIEAVYAEDFKKFLVESVLPYLKQVLPSSAIFEYEIIERNAVDTQVYNTTGGVNLQNVNAFVAENEPNDDVIINYTDGSFLPIQDNNTEEEG